MNISVFKGSKTYAGPTGSEISDLLKVLRHATVQRISEVLQRLLSERVSVRNMK